MRKGSQLLNLLQPGLEPVETLLPHHVDSAAPRSPRNGGWEGEGASASQRGSWSWPGSWAQPRAVWFVPAGASADWLWRRWTWVRTARPAHSLAEHSISTTPAPREPAALTAESKGRMSAGKGVHLGCSLPSSETQHCWILTAMRVFQRYLQRPRGSFRRRGLPVGKGTWLLAREVLGVCALGV